MEAVGVVGLTPAIYKLAQMAVLVAEVLLLQVFHLELVELGILQPQPQVRVAMEVLGLLAALIMEAVAEVELVLLVAMELAQLGALVVLELLLAFQEVLLPTLEAEVVLHIMAEHLELAVVVVVALV
jgi:hypothetical protein